MIEVVLLHGGPGAIGGMGQLARELSDDFHVLAPKQRRAGGKPLTVARHVADLAQVAPPDARIVGWSWGAMLALSFATRHPERVRSLALVGCGTYDENSRASYHRAVDARLGPAGRRRVEELRRQMAGDPASADRTMAELGLLLTSAQSVELIEPPEPVECDARAHDETWLDALRLQREGVEPAAFAAIRVPVLMLHGDSDPHPGPLMHDQLRRHLPQLEYLELPRCGHLPWLERHAREPFLRALREWLSR